MKPHGADNLSRLPSHRLSLSSCISFVPPCKAGFPDFLPLSLQEREPGGEVPVTLMTDRYVAHFISSFR